MKEYNVIEIKCKKDINLVYVHSLIKSTLSYNANIFALQNLKLKSLRKKCYEMYEKLNLQKYEYRIVLEHLLNTTYYDPEKNDRRMISNLDNNWEWHNDAINGSMQDEDFDALFAFCDSLNTLDVSTLILGFDQIQWTDDKIGKGTYGYKKADCTYGLGNNYLSNSVIIGRTYENKSYTAFISCEKRFRDLEIINKIAASLGEIVRENSYFAPENEDERIEWNDIYENEKSKFEKVTDHLIKLYLKERTVTSTQDRLKYLEAERSIKINIKGYINKYLCNDGWKKRPARKNERPIIIFKNKGNKEIAFSIISGHNGHHVQVLVTYSNEKFNFCENLYSISDNLISDNDAEELFGKILEVRNYFYDAM